VRAPAMTSYDVKHEAGPGWQERGGSKGGRWLRQTPARPAGPLASIPGETYGKADRQYGCVSLNNPLSIRFQLEFMRWRRRRRERTAFGTALLGKGVYNLGIKLKVHVFHLRNSMKLLLVRPAKFTFLILILIFRMHSTSNCNRNIGNFGYL